MPVAEICRHVDGAPFICRPTKERSITITSEWNSIGTNPLHADERDLVRKRRFLWNREL
jgi:hypothetical protein